ncbi:hypothetical protein N7G274_000017 [Stereocaulon virgatum]|uniref:XPG-I domain-containing protein n=1 Tax=Stereocaulon virgatum TaxID=373712 RepID=A0ABR4ATM5_9LECA
MGIQLFDDWSGKVAKSFDLKFLKGCKIGVDATYFLRSLPKESLQPALGGVPLCLETKAIARINNLQTAGLQLHFVFNGLDSGIGYDPVARAARAAEANHKAFSIYEARHAAEANEVFRSSGLSDITSMSETLKKILYEHGIPFTVAPYSALAQLVYYERHPSQYIDAVYGPSDLFCFGIDKMITNFKPEASQFDWIDRRDCLADLGNISSHVFIDALMLAGSDLLPMFPSFMNQTVYPKPPTFRSIVQVISTSGASVPRLCAQSLANPSVKTQYLDQYKRAMARIRHHVVITAEGDVEALNKEIAPDDIHECIGLRLPEELYMYLSRGMLRPRVLNWLTSGKINITQPLAGGDGQPYQDLVKTQLEPLRRQALSLLTKPINWYFRFEDITTRLWFDPTYEGKFKIEPLLSATDQLSTWHVKNDLIADFTNEDMPSGSLSFALLTLGNVDLAAKTVTPKPKVGHEPLKLPNEILANVVWRFLQLRGYVDEQHQLTEWGKILETALDAAGTRKDQEEAVFIAVELLRFELVSPDTMFLGYAGAPEHGTDIEKRNVMMVSRVACLGKIRHQPKAYSGPLSRHLLAYQSIISNLQASLRDLVEMILTAMFLEGSVNRDRDDWMQLSLGLPFYEEHSCALGVLTMHYLDELCLYTSEATSKVTRSAVREKGQSWIQNSDFSGSLDDAFQVWDALYKGVKAAGNKVKDRQMWDEVNEWLSERK